ncbi:urease accessory protein UreE [Alkalilacustris brevis]|uniref:urease accessory protein UreE n=1 Tax=Alkalilacustris brevis TaxID=2026338 RepID=UPI000E0DE58C|nr:urease accessory protein UreE [Alkalilacustris brevis]
MSDLPAAHEIARAGDWKGPATDEVLLDYEARFLRRKRLVCKSGAGFLVNLAETVSLDDGDAFRLGDGRLIAVRAAPEPVLQVRGDLPRLAWHIGNRHTPCQIGPDRLVIRADHVIEAMLRQLGAEVAPGQAPFTPEGGAYGHGRTMGHDHGPSHHHHHHSVAAAGPER